MAKNVTGRTKATKESLLLNAGAWFKNFDVGVDTFESALADGKCLGATQGGGNFTATPEVRLIEIDGSDPITVYDSWTVTMMANMIEVKPDTLALALGTGIIADADGALAEKYFTIRAKRQIDTGTDYIESITWVGTLSGSNEPVIIQIFNAISNSGINMNMAPKANGILSVTFSSSTDEDNLEDAAEFAPFIIYYPKSVAVPTINPIDSDSTTITGTGTVGAVVHFSGGTIPADAHATVSAGGTYTHTIPKQAVGVRVVAYQQIGGRRSLDVSVYVTAADLGGGA